MVGKVISLVLRVGLAGIFLAAGVVKIWDFQHGHSATPDFTLAIQNYHLIPWPDATMLLAVYLPWVEVIAALGLFTRKLRLGASVLLSGLMIIFLVAIGSAWARGLEIACGCFGKDEFSTDYRALMFRDGCILIALVVLVTIEWRGLRKTAPPGAGSVAGSPGGD